MEKRIVIKVDEYGSFDELDPVDRNLLEHAIKATETSYSPYSSFRVGAALRLANGEIMCGSNQENAAYPSGLCAERVVLFHAQSRYPDVPAEALAVYACSEDFKLDNPVTPCGACRQVMAEHESRHRRKMRVIMGGANGMVQITDGIENLLPLTFMLDKLKKRRKTNNE